MQTPRFHATSCSQCGRDCGPGDAGYSHCSDHEADLIAADRAANAAKGDPAAFQRRIDTMQREEIRMLRIMRAL